MSTEGLGRKKRIRAGYRAATTRLLNEIKPMLAADTIDFPKLAQLKLSLEEKLKTLRQLDSEILDLTEEEAIENEILQADEYKDGIYSTIVNLDEKMKSTTPGATATATSGVTLPTTSTSTATSGATPAAEISTTRDREHRVKLPKLTIQPFDGNITSWMSFWDSYDSAIHQNSTITDIEKFNYLRTFLKGSARDSIAGLTLTAANYAEAISLLKKRYGNKQAIIGRHMDTLMSLNAVTSNHDIKGLRHLYDMLESNIRSLKGLGIESNSYGSLLCSVVINKLPSELRLIVGRKLGGEEWELDAIMKELLQEIEARERMSTLKNPKPTVKEPGTAATLFSKGSMLHCCFCNQQHQPEKCRIVKGAEDRKQALRKYGRCFICLRKGHISRECHSKTKCSECGGKHHTTICNRPTSQVQEKLTNADAPKPPNPSVSATGLNPVAKSFQPVPSNSALLVEAKNAVLLQTATVKVYNPENLAQSVRVRAILDSGSQQSYVTQRVKDLLSIEAVSKSTMSIMTFGSDQPSTQVYDVVKIGIATKEGDDEELDLFSVPVICQPLTSQPIDLCVEKYQHLSDLELADSAESDVPMEVDLLIGSNYYWSFATGEIRRGEDGPVAIYTKFGWILSGAVPTENEPLSSLTFLNTHILRVDSVQHTESLDEVLHSFWNLESLGIGTTDISVLEEFKNTIQFKEGHYEVTLPWKEGHPPLPDNYELSKRRLNGLLRRLKQNPEVLQEYDSIIQSQLQKGIVEEVRTSDDEVAGQVHYLPHHAVVKTDRETTKVRVVYDASAKSTGCSLNDCLHAGPKFEQRIMDILLRFRTFPIALAADIEKAFLMVAIAEEDRDVLRFLWVNDVNRETPEIRSFRFTRAVFGVTSSPFLLNATLQHHLNLFTETHPDLIRLLSKSTYVDDIVCGAKNEEEAYDLFRDSKEVLRRGGFNLRKFITNSSDLQLKINEKEGVNVNVSKKSPVISNSDETYTKTTLGSAQAVQPGEQKILGVRWDATNDQLCFGFGEIARHATTLKPTKRNIISTVGRFYDPMGFLSPIVIRFKVLLQELCERKQDWDELLAEDLLAKWNKLVTELASSSFLTIPRCLMEGIYSASSDCTFSLCGFCDASKQAYAAVIYLVIKTPEDQFVKFITSKTRVAPLKTQTIPRLELLSALLLSKLMKSVSDSLESEMKLTFPSCYTDSQVALYWILGVNRTWKQFVQHRVMEIRSLLSHDCWHHCAGTENPADLPSRGLSPVELSQSRLWSNGPEWLGKETSEGPVQELTMPEECTEELRVKDKLKVLNLLNADGGPSLSRIIDCSNYSSIQKLLRVTAYVMKFIEALKKKSNDTTERVSILSAEDIHNAELMWIKEAQKLLLSDRSFTRLKTQFGLFKDEDEVWRCGGRLTNADISFEEKHPILVPRNHYFSLLIVQRAHARVYHNGVKETLTEVRSKYWIIKGRSFVRKIIHQCVICKKIEGKHFSGPPPPPLPKFRLERTPPFTHTGVDFAGPLYIKTDKSSSGDKVWICLYTCCVTRAIHLEVVMDMTTSSFVRCLKRFSSRRGLPKHFISDNGKTFKAGAKVIMKILNHEDVTQYLSGVGVDWSFNLEKAPWWGGVFERMVRMTKRCLKKTIGRARLTYDELTTMLTEVEAVINSRPLTCVTSDDLEQPLTPSHLLNGRRLLNLPDSVLYQDLEEDITPRHLNRRMVYLNRISDNFWKRWSSEYLLELRDAHRYAEKSSKPGVVNTGDIVLVHDESKPRGFWKLALVCDIIIGKDGQLRGAVVKTGSGSLLRRPLQRLYPLEVSDVGRDTPQEASNDQEEKDHSDTQNSARSLPGTESVTQVSDRPVRAAAQRARHLTQAIANYEQSEDELSD